jgi:hypothetical protein
LWNHVEPLFRDLVGGLTNFDPAMRLTAEEALQHKWFADVDEGEGMMSMAELLARRNGGEVEQRFTLLSNVYGALLGYLRWPFGKA